MKFCPECRQTKPLDQFAKQGFFKGKQSYRPRCKGCYATKVRKARHDQHVFTEVSPHGKGIVRVSVKGWGYSGATQ